jgi:hypothetical protein
MTAHEIIQECQYGRMAEEVALAELAKIGVRGEFQEDDRFIGHNKEGQLIESAHGITIVKESTK